MTCDLHVHSMFSDGTFTPEELITHAQKLGISAIALCDHNTTDGLERFIKAGEKSPVEAIPSIEISTEYNDTELHILALNIPKDNIPLFADLMADTRKKKEENNLELVEKLRADGYNISYDKIKEENKSSYINRLHIAYALIDAGYMPTVAEAYDTLLKPYGKYYTPPKRLDSLDTIEFIAKSGAIPVWAHPFLNMSYEETDAFLPLAKARGLVGMEALYSTYSPEEEKLAFDLCKKYGILPSGGSDFHAAAKPDIEMGIGKGNLTIPIEIYENLVRK